jgi:hypothetical protein
MVGEKHFPARASMCRASANCAERLDCGASTATFTIALRHSTVFFGSGLMEFSQ